MYIVLGAVILIYIWRIFRGSRHGLIDEVGAFADIIIISAMVVAGIVVAESILGKNLIGFLVAGILFLIILITRKLLRIIFCSLGLVAKLPLLNGLNKLFGTIAGAIEATVIIWVGFAVISCLRIPVYGQHLAELIAANRVLNFLYQNNLLYRFVQRVTGIFLRITYF